MEEKISVIIPVYNTEKYLSDCIESVLGQTYKNLELFLVDDGSTDNSLEICRKYAEEDSRVIVLTKENGGQGSARNLALDRMTGEYVSFIDADDYIKENMYETMIGQMKELDADISLCGICHVYDNGTVIENAIPGRCIYSNYELMKSYVTTSYVHTGPCNKVYKSKLFCDIRFPHVRANEDAYIMHEILGRCRTAVHVGQCFYMQNIVKNSTEQKPFSKTNLVLLECARRLICYYSENYSELVKYVVYKEVNDTAALMKRILCVSLYLNDRDIYKQLSKDIKLKYNQVKLRYPDGEGITSNALCAVKHPIRFFIVNFLKGIKYKYCC